MADGGDGTARRVPKKLRRARTNSSYLDVQDDEAVSVAWLAAVGCTGSTTIPRRSWLPRRTASVEDGCVLLRAETSPHGVKMKSKVEIRRKKVEGGGEVVGARRKWRSTAAAVAELEGGVRAAWGLKG